MPRLRFGTDGIRGKFGDELTADIAYRIGRRLGQYPNGRFNRIVLSMDTRESSPILADALSKGIVDAGGSVYEEGVSTTPSISYLVQKEHFDYGVMISASHNPYFDNGIKVFSSNGEKTKEDLEIELENALSLPLEELPEGKGHRIIEPSLKEEYVSWLCSKASPNLKGMKVVFDLANGSASAVAMEVFKRLKLDALYLFSSPDGKNINNGCGSTHMEHLTSQTKKGHFEIGIAFDGDADRMLAVDGKGNLIDGDVLLLLHSICLKSKGKLQGNGIVATIMSNAALDEAISKQNINLKRVSVGDKNVQAALKENGFILGGEPSGHTIFFEHLNTGDGVLSAIMLLNLIADNPEIFAKRIEYKPYPQVMENVRFDNREDIPMVLGSESFKKDKARQEEKIAGKGRILIRPSGTEPLIRVLVECKSPLLCKKIAHELVKTIKEAC